MMTCLASTHDHAFVLDDEDDELTATDSMRCRHCGQPCHYDAALELYQHDSPTADDCFLIRRRPEASPCIEVQGQKMLKQYWVNHYEVQREYGGPEEGGWWYDTGTVVASYGPFPRTEAEGVAAALREDNYEYRIPGDRSTRKRHRFSVLGGYDDEIWIETHIGKEFPEETPHYE